MVRSAKLDCLEKEELNFAFNLVRKDMDIREHERLFNLVSIERQCNTAATIFASIF